MLHPDISRKGNHRLWGKSVPNLLWNQKPYFPLLWRFQKPGFLSLKWNSHLPNSAYREKLYNNSVSTRPLTNGVLFMRCVKGTQPTFVMRNRLPEVGAVCDTLTVVPQWRGTEKSVDLVRNEPLPLKIVDNGATVDCELLLYYKYCSLAIIAEEVISAIYHRETVSLSANHAVYMEYHHEMIAIA